MTGYSFTTPVWEGGRWVAPVVAGVTATARIANGPEDRPHDAPASLPIRRRSVRHSES